MFTGSGMPMRFAGAGGPFDGTPIDVYQATTQLTDEWGPGDEIDVGVETHINSLLNRALGPEGYYGAFTANMHTDEPNHPGTDIIVNAAKSRDVPVVSAAQMLDWLDGREGSSFQGLSYSGNQLRFALQRGATARGLEAMLPAGTAAGGLSALTRDGAAVAVTARNVKGIDYAVFDAAPGLVRRDLRARRVAAGRRAEAASSHFPCRRSARAGRSRRRRSSSTSAARACAATGASACGCAARGPSTTASRR